MKYLCSVGSTYYCYFQGSHFHHDLPTYHFLAHESVPVAAAAAVGEGLAVAGGLVEGPPLEVAAAPPAVRRQRARGRVHCNEEDFEERLRGL